jgi:myo-inositol-1(or 4)-monophosphatase
MTTTSPGQPTATPAERRALLATCVAAAVSASGIIRSAAGTRHTLTWEEKSPADFVSTVDRAAEEALAGVIAARHPDATLVAEEGAPTLHQPGGLVFVADPLDGTTNFLHGFPWYAVSIAAMIDGVLAAGAILNAATGELFTVTAGGGARRAGEPITVSTLAEPRRALIGTGFPFRDGRDVVDRYLSVLPDLMMGTAGLRRPGSAALDLADVACGRFDGFFEMRLAPWDVAAGILLVREAGGVVTDLQGNPAPVAHTPIVAGNPQIHQWLLQRLAPIA